MKGRAHALDSRYESYLQRRGSRSRSCGAQNSGAASELDRADKAPICETGDQVYRLARNSGTAIGCQQERHRLIVDLGDKDARSVRLEL